MKSLSGSKISGMVMRNVELENQNMCLPISDIEIHNTLITNDSNSKVCFQSRKLVALTREFENRELYYKEFAPTSIMDVRMPDEKEMESWQFAFLQSFWSIIYLWNQAKIISKNKSPLKPIPATSTTSRSSSTRPSTSTESTPSSNRTSCPSCNSVPHRK